MNRKQALIIIGGMASLFLSGCAQLVPPHHPQLPLSPGALDGRVRGVLDANALALDRSPWPCLAALPQEVVIASSWFVVDYRLPTDPHRQQGIAKEVPQLPVSVGDHVEVFPGNCQRGELARIGAILAAELPDADLPVSVPAKVVPPAPPAPVDPAATSAANAAVNPGDAPAGEPVTESVTVPAAQSVTQLGPVTPQDSVPANTARPPPR